MKWSSLLLMLLISVSLFSQDRVFEKDVRKQKSKSLSGPNTKHHFSNTLALGINVPIDESENLKSNGQSLHLAYMGRYKRKFNEWFSWGVDMQYNRDAYGIAQDSLLNILGGGEVYDKQKLLLNKFGLSTGLRITYTKRGNFIGNYIELFGQADYIFAHRLYQSIDVQPSAAMGSSKVKTSFTKLDYLEKTQLSGVVRFGFNRFSILGRYRFSDLFKPSQNINAGNKLPELTRYTFALEIAF